VACVYGIAVGAVLLWLGWVANDHANVAGATVLFTFGGGALIVAPFLTRLEGTFRIGPLELTLEKKVIRAVQRADEESLEALLPLVSREDLDVRKLKLPPRFQGHKLTDPELGFLRKTLNVSVVAIHPPDRDEWVAGGAVSELRLGRNMELLVAGHPDTLSYLAMLVAADRDDLWERVPQMVADQAQGTDS
jgi:hypothetical protein